MGWGTAQWLYGYTNQRCVQAYVTASITSQTDTTATIKITGYGRSGNGSGYYYISDYGAYIKLYSKLGSGSNTQRGSSTYCIVNYGNNVGNTSATFTVSKSSSAQTLMCYTYFESSTDSWSTATSSITLTIPAQTTWTVSYSANGGSGTLPSQTKQKDVALTLHGGSSSTTPTRSGYNFLGWSTSSSATSASYAAGGSYTANASVTLYAVWKIKTYTVSYNANGGSGAPASQTKTHGKTLVLSTTKPTRTNYSFLGWSTSSSATTSTYSPGANYTTDAALPLYAVWKLNYVNPKITSCTARRCDSSGTASDEGKYAYVTVKWEVDTNYKGKSIAFAYKKSTDADSAYVSVTDTSSSVTTVRTGTLSKTIGGNNISTDYTYNVRVTLTDTNNKKAISYVTLSPSFFTLDILAGGKGIAIGKSATTSNLLDVAMPLGVKEHGMSITDSRLDVDRETPLTSTEYSKTLAFNDKDGITAAYIQAYETENGIGLLLSSRISSSVYNYLRLFTGRDGSYTYGVRDASKFRSAISAAQIGSFAGSSQHWGVGATVSNSNNTTYNGKKTWLVLTNSGLYAYNGTDSASVWQISGVSGTLNLGKTTLVHNAYETITVWGRTVTIHVHGRTGTPGASGNYISTSLADYLPSSGSTTKYNISTLVADSSASNHVARLWVDTSGNIKLASVGYTTSAAWYGTLTYIY